MSQTRKLKDVAHEAGISYRQANYWAATGYIQAIPYRASGHKLERVDESKSGRIHRLELPEADILLTMARLVNAGFPAGTAAEIARTHIEDGKHIYELSDGIWLTIAEEAT